VFTLGGIYFLRRSIKQTKRKTECKSRKNSKTKTEH
jgi:hypothetical protein